MQAETNNNNFEKEIRSALEKWEIPGFAIAIVKDGKIVLSKGCGVCKLGEINPIDELTLFSIGSLTKSFTSQALSILVKQGKIHWDDPVIKYIPNFYLFNSYVTQEITIRDLLSHRSGLAAHEGDLLWFKTNYDRQEILRRIRFLKSKEGFRAKYAYQNVLYLVAAEIIQSITGESWDEFLKKNLFSPLEMRSTIPSLPSSVGQTNIASPHAKLDGQLRSIDWISVDNIAPAASIVSNLSDMIQWMKFILESEKSENESFTFDQEILKPQIMIDPDPFLMQFFPDSHFLSYGLGLVLHDYHGLKIIQHDGIINGMTNLMVIVPEEKLGILILTNVRDSFLPYLLSYKLVDHYLKINTRDWDKHFADVSKQLEEDNTNHEKEIQREHVLNTNPSFSLDQYTGSFTNNLLGAITISLNKGELEARLIAEKGKLVHWHYDTFRFFPDDPQLLKPLITFSINSQGEIEALKISDITDECFYKIQQTSKRQAKPSLIE